MTGLGVLFLGGAVSALLALVGTKRKPLIFVTVGFAVAGAVFLTVGAAQDGDSRPSVTTATKSQIYSPIGLAGKIAQDVRIGSDASGECFNPSLVNFRVNVWRCITSRSKIEDPCWPLSRFEVLCAPRGPSTPLDRVRLSHPLPLRFPDSPTFPKRPWALELADGAQCIWNSGASVAVTGEHVAYTCDNGDQVINELDRSDPLWRATVFKEGGSASHSVGVTNAWF
jgi:hypothetical protein